MARQRVTGKTSWFLTDFPPPQAAPEQKLPQALRAKVGKRAKQFMGLAKKAVPGKKTITKSCTTTVARPGKAPQTHKVTSTAVYS